MSNSHPTGELKRRSRFAVFPAVILLVSVPGCGTALTLCDVDREGTRYGYIYSGVRFDHRAITDPDYMQHIPFGKPLCAIDLPLAALADTVVLPGTLIAETQLSRATDERLYGTWIIDTEKVMARHQYVCELLEITESAEKVAEVKRASSNRTVTFSAHTFLMNHEGATTRSPYRVVDKTPNGFENGVEIRRNGQRELIEFDGEGFWFDCFGAGLMEYYRKQSPSSQTSPSASSPSD